MLMLQHFASAFAGVSDGCMCDDCLRLERMEDGRPQGAVGGGVAGGGNSSSGGRGGSPPEGAHSEVATAVRQPTPHVGSAFVMRRM